MLLRVPVFRESGPRDSQPHNSSFQGHYQVSPKVASTVATWEVCALAPLQLSKTMGNMLAGTTVPEKAPDLRTQELRWKIQKVSDS